MPPKFLVSSFEFEEGEVVPEHIEGFPDLRERDKTKIWLEGEDTFSYELYTLAVDIDDITTAGTLKAARLRRLEREQATDTSGGQSPDGIQDAIHIRTS